MGESSYDFLCPLDFLLGNVLSRLEAEWNGMGIGMVSNPMARGVRSFGNSTTAGLGKLFADHKKGCQDAPLGKHVQHMRSYVGIGAVVETQG
jgi:hypothetical protein